MVASAQVPETKKSQFKIIVTLFVIMRLTILFFYSSQGMFAAYSDYFYYYWSAQLTDQGYYPFVNMWYEYPPISAYLPVAIYRLVHAILPMGDINSFGYMMFSHLLGLVFLIFDIGILILVYKIAERMWGIEKAEGLTWIYSVLNLPLFFWTYAHQSVVGFFLLLSIYLFIIQKPGRSAVALGLGIASKITPAFMLAPAIRFLWPKRRTLAGYTGLALLTAGLVYLPFLLLGGARWIAASFLALTKVGSYGTVWAILDGNWSFGNYGPLATRLQLDQASVLHGNPPVLPEVLVIGIFAVLYGLFFFKPVDRQDARHFVWFSTLTMLIFHLWLKGWSPRWSVMIVPLLLLSFPNNKGLLLTLLFTGLVFLDWPLPASVEPKILYAFFTFLRTAFFVAVCLLLAQRLWRTKGDRIIVDV